MICQTEIHWMIAKAQENNRTCSICDRYILGVRGTTHTGFQRHLVSKHGYWVRKPNA
ncbi:hypothetical protein LCGC14_0315980 [marine sediment metagenome]|uniref:Uncharacterized protein n=1 Tax=marine sediment metagenome TaxID=412755 RepID=A0A0F9W7M4_9ZZZZ